MKEYDGQITSSPGPTPVASSARWSAVVHDVVATAWAAPTRAATTRSNSATFGPCVTQPLESTSATARASASPNSRRVSGMLTGWISSLPTAHAATTPPDREGRLRAGLRRGSPSPAAPPRPKRRRRGTGLIRRAAASWGRSFEPMTASSRSASWLKEVSTPVPTLNTASLAVGGHGQHVGARHVAHVHEVHGLRAVAEDDRRAAAFDRIHPANHDFGVGAVHVHPGTVHVERPQRDVFQTVHVVEAAEQALVEQLRGSIERPIVVRMVRLAGRKFLGQPVHRR